MKIQDIKDWFFVHFSSESFMHWIAQRRKPLMNGLSAALILLIVSIFLAKPKDGKAVRASSISTIDKWLKGAEPDAGIIEQLCKQDPSVKALFAGRIAQKLLIEEDTSSARKYSKDLLRVTQAECPFYSRYSQTSFVIAEKKWQQALKEALLLKSDLEKDPSFWEKQNKQIPFGPYLYAMNVLRIALLEHKMGHVEEELKAWVELEKIAGWDKNPSQSTFTSNEARHFLEQGFICEDLTLKDFAAIRKNSLQALVAQTK